MVRSSVFSLTAVIISLALASNASAIHEGLQVLYEFDGNTSPALGANTAPSGNAGTNSGVAPAAGFIGSGASDWAADGAIISVSGSDLPNIEFPGGGAGDGGISTSFWLKTTETARSTFFSTGNLPYGLHP